MAHTRALVRSVVVAAVALAAIASCGGSSPTSPGGGGGVTVIVAAGGTGPSGATVTITAAGVSPSSVTVAVGQAVTFVNNDSRQHEMGSDPHPNHGSCPSIEAGVSLLAPGQTKVTRAFANAGTCRYHDHLNDSNQTLRGTIVVQ
jgi:plastocyanin